MRQLRVACGRHSSINSYLLFEFSNSQLTFISIAVGLRRIKDVSKWLLVEPNKPRKYACTLLTNSYFGNCQPTDEREY